MRILVNQKKKKKSSSSCNYTCPVYNMGIKGFKDMFKKWGKKKRKKKKQPAWKVCWYDN